jgi:hypothetical protein
MIYSDEATMEPEYRRLKIVEFCDFLVRLSEMKFASQKGMASIDKLEETLDILFRLINKERVLSQRLEIELSSESDYESED